MNFDDIKKLPGLLESLVTAIPQEIEAGVMRGVSALESRVTALEGKAETTVDVDFDGKVKTALSDIFGADFDLSGLESALAAFGGSAASSSPAPVVPVTVEPPAPLPAMPVVEAPAPAPAPVDTSKKADLSSLMPSVASVDPVASPAAVGSADTSTATLGSQGSQDPATPPAPAPASVPQKVDPASAGKLAADAASATGDDPVPAAAKAAHAAATELGVDPVSAATAAAAAAGAGPVEASRAAQNADLAANEGQAPATS